MSYQLTTLNNGLRIATEYLPGVETVSVAMSVNVGARNERTDQHGISHLLEHMAFKGTKKRSAQDIAEAFDAVGGQLNAYTSHEMTVYYSKTLKENAALSIDVLCDILQHSVFDAQELEKEKHVILQELAMHNDTPDDLVFDYFQETAFHDQILGRSILGTADSITSHQSDALRDYVAHHYQPESIVFSAAGNLQHDQIVALVKEHLDAFNQPTKPIMDEARYVGGSAIIKKPLEQVQCLLGVESFPIHDARYYPLQLLSIALGGGMSSRLFQEVREKRGLVYTIQSFVSCYQDTGLFAIYAATGEEDVEEMIPVICEQLHGISESLSEEELQRAKNQHIANLLMARESSASVAEWIGRHLLSFNEYRNADAMRQMVENVQVDDIKALARDIFTNPKVTVAGLGKTSKLASAEAIEEKLAA
ncbi:MAG: insulinase family protein [Rickettsiales bacterium]|nr:insulinase family protein [Rickettsiales bacterium]